jgi:hypothetical protein
MSAVRNIFVPPAPTDSFETDRPIEPGVRPTLPRLAGREPAATSVRQSVTARGQARADLRRRPIRVVIADICRDLGITEQHPLWPEVAVAITAFGGSIAELEEDSASGIRWCSKTWMDLPVPVGPVIRSFSTLRAWETYLARTGKVDVHCVEAATGPP